MLKSRALIVIIALLAFAPALVGCPTSGGGNQNGPDAIAAGDTAFDNGEISFDVPGGLLTYRQIEELRNMDVSQFEGYVTGVTVAADGAVTIAVTNGEEATATVTIPAGQVNELGDVLEEAQSQVIETRDAAGIDPDEINNGLIKGFVLTGNENNPYVEIHVYTHGLTNAQRAEIVDGEDPSHATAGSLQERFALLNALAMDRIADNNITKFVIVDSESMTEGERSMQFVDFTNRVDNTDGFAAIVPFEDTLGLGTRINWARGAIEDGQVPTPGVRAIWPIPANAQALGGARVRPLPYPTSNEN